MSTQKNTPGGIRGAQQKQRTEHSSDYTPNDFSKQTTTNHFILAKHKRENLLKRSALLLLLCVFSKVGVTHDK